MTRLPELRFAGFAGDWEEKKISDIGKLTAGGDINKSILKEEGKYPVIANGDTNNGIVGYYDSDYKIEGPAVTISARGNIGTAVARNYNFTPVVRLLTLKTEYNIYFTAEILNRLKIFNESTGVAQLTSPQLSSYKITIPPIIEQEKLGELFIKIDQLIENQEKLLDQSIAFKKSMLQKMFPKKGSLVPEFRFNSFKGDWKQHSFKDIYGNYESGNRLPKSQLKNGEIPYILAKTSDNGIYMRIDKNTLDYSGNKMKLFKPNSITFSIDNPEAIFIQKEHFFTSNIMRVFYNKKHNKYHTIFFKTQFQKTTQGFGWGNKFSGPVALESKLFIPVKNNSINFEEIEMIGYFINNLDEKIARKKNY